MDHIAIVIDIAMVTVQVFNFAGEGGPFFKNEITNFAKIKLCKS